MLLLYEKYYYIVMYFIQVYVNYAKYQFYTYGYFKLDIRVLQ
jgi:hypothetical protein